MNARDSIELKVSYIYIYSYHAQKLISLFSISLNMIRIEDIVVEHKQIAQRLNLIGRTMILIKVTIQRQVQRAKETTEYDG